MILTLNSDNYPLKSAMNTRNKHALISQINEFRYDKLLIVQITFMKHVLQPKNTQEI